MSNLLHDLLLRTAAAKPESQAILYKETAVTYADMADMARRTAEGLVTIGLRRQDRVGVYLPKRPETVATMFGTTLAGGAFVPLNPLLKAEQLGHILNDCNVRVFVTSAQSYLQLRDALVACEDLSAVIVLDVDVAPDDGAVPFSVLTWEALLSGEPGGRLHRVIDVDMAAIFYTSGSTGKPKGVVLSHRNMVAGARSVAQYLGNHAEDRLLAVLPLSFDYGFSQLSTAFVSGAAVGLMDYLFPKDVVLALEKYSITGLAGVPPLWVQIAKREWPSGATENLRYITNSGGAMPRVTLQQLRAKLPDTDVFLMYGLTEAFRSTYLPPAELDRRPDSMGKAIPNAEVMVVREDGTRCQPGEPGELVHRGALVAHGYWGDPERTAERFKPVPDQNNALVLPELAVWSGDTVRADEDGFLYFVGRRDDMIKTSGYRVSPSEVEEAVYGADCVAEAIAVGVPHPELGQGIVVVAVSAPDHEADTDAIVAECRRHLPTYMLPGQVEWRDSLPRNPNGKIDRKRIQTEVADIFQDVGS